MTKNKKKLTAILMTVAMLILLFPVSVFATESHENQVHVIVENMTYGTASGAPWEGRKVDVWVTLNDASTGLSVLEEAVGAGNLNVSSGSWGTFINGILGITNGDGGSIGASGYNMAGWMYAMNGTMASLGIDQVSVAGGTLSAGDELSFHYSLDGGPDIGYDWSNTTQKALKALNINTGVLSPAFSSGVTSYTLTVPAEVTGIVVSPEAENMNETVTISVNGTAYKRAMNLPVSNGTQIIVTCTNGDGTEETSYSILVKQAGTAGADAMYTDVMGVLNASLTDDVCGYGNEWMIMSMARAGVLDEAKANLYYADLEKTVKELGSGKLDSTYATTNARVILALSAIGKDPSNVAGYNLLEPLADMDYITKQGINAAMYALLAFDANDYDIPVAAPGVTQTTREGLIQAILDAELSGGGWDWMGASADPDLTANALQALAPYYNSNPAVRDAVDRGLQALSGMQNPDGSYSSWGTQNACSTAQVLTALTSLGIDPMTDDRFVKNGYTIIHALEDFYVAGSGFRYDLSSTDIDLPYSTVQASYALVSYERFVNQKNTLFDMTDAFSKEQETTTTEAAATAKDKTPATGDSISVTFLFGLALISAAGVVAVNKKKQA